MQIDSKTILIVVLGALLLFMVFQITDAGSSTGAAVANANYASNPYSGGGAAPVNVNNLPQMVGGC